LPKDILKAELAELLYRLRPSCGICVCHHHFECRKTSVPIKTYDSQYCGDFVTDREAMYEWEERITKLFDKRADELKGKVEEWLKTT